MDIKKLTEQGSGKVNEDSLFASENTFGVFDGATSLEKYMNEDGLTGGIIASRFVSKTFSQDKELSEILKEANTQLRELMLSSGVDIKQGINRWSTTASVVRLYENYFEWANIGDSSILVIDEDETYNLISPYKNHDLEVLKLVKDFDKNKIDNLWEYQPFVNASIKLQNNRNITYGVLDGSKEAESFISGGTVSLENIKHILLLTDGCYIPQQNPSDDEDFSTLTNIFLKDGVDGLKNYVRDLENNDPKLEKYPRFKKSDDLTVIAISF